MKFVTEVFHPNVYGNGDICLDILSKLWSPVLDIATILVSIRSLLNDPNVDSPANPVAARMLQDDPSGYRRAVRKVASRSVDA